MTDSLPKLNERLGKFAETVIRDFHP